MQRVARKATPRPATDLAEASAQGGLGPVPAPSKPPHRYVYVIGPAAGLQKVGIATDPRSRLAALQTAVPFNLILHAAVRVPFAQAHAVERRAHKLLADVCARNEWFHCTPEKAIAAVQEAATPSKPIPPEWRPASVLAGALPLFAYRR